MRNRIVLGVTAVSFSLLASSAALADYQCKVDEIAEAKNDVDVYDSPVKPRKKYPDYFITTGTHGIVLERHEHGWCKLQGVAPDGSAGWVAEDHLKAASGGMESKPGSGDDSSMESEPMPDTGEPEGEMDEGEEQPEMEGGGAGGGGAVGEPN